MYGEVKPKNSYDSGEVTREKHPQMAQHWPCALPRHITLVQDDDHQIVDSPLGPEPCCAGLEHWAPSNDKTKSGRCLAPGLLIQGWSGIYFFLSLIPRPQAPWPALCHQQSTYHCLNLWLEGFPIAPTESSPNLHVSPQHTHPHLWILGWTETRLGSCKPSKAPQSMAV